MNTKLKHAIENSRINKQNIKLYPQKTPEHNIYEITEKLVQLPNGSFVSKKLKLTYGKDIDPHYEDPNHHPTWQNIMT